MATVTQWDREEEQRRVASPLQQLSGYIRLYVMPKGSPSCSSTSRSVVLDRSAARLWPVQGRRRRLGADPATRLPRHRPRHAHGRPARRRRCQGYCACSASSARKALALVLERRYPELLGDRLITAVELAEPGLARQYRFRNRCSNRRFTMPPSVSRRSACRRCSTGNA